MSRLVRTDGYVYQGLDVTDHLRNTVTSLPPSRPDGRRGLRFWGRQARLSRDGPIPLTLHRTLVTPMRRDHPDGELLPSREDSLGYFISTGDTSAAAT